MTRSLPLALLLLFFLLANPEPLATATEEYRAARVNTTIASPYNSESPYSNVESNQISQPAGASLSGKPTTSNKVESAVGEMKERVMPSSSAHQNEKSNATSDFGTAKIMPSSSSASHHHDTSGATGATSALGYANRSKSEQYGSSPTANFSAPTAAGAEHGGPGTHPSGKHDNTQSYETGADSSEQLSPGGGAGSEGVSKKPSLMNKIKGEMKVLSGKMSNNDEKVEQGKALKSGSQP